jgi:nucleolar protein 16
MNPRAKGGSEMIITPGTATGSLEQSGDTPAATKVLPKGYGRIVRDAEGNVVDIELEDSFDSDEMDSDENALDLETRQLQPNFTSSEGEKWTRRRAANAQDSELIQGMCGEVQIFWAIDFCLVNRPRNAVKKSGEGPSDRFYW